MNLFTVASGELMYYGFSESLARVAQYRYRAELMLHGMIKCVIFGKIRCTGVYYIIRHYL